MPVLSRLRSLGSHVAPAGVATEQLHWSQPTPMATPRLLDDAQLQKFVVDGFLVLNLEDDFAPGFHRQLHEDAQEIFERSGRAGGGAGKDGLSNSNDIYPAIPDLGAVMTSSTIAGALESVLGPGYQMAGHRHMHNSVVGNDDQTFHKDSQRNKPPLHNPGALFIFCEFVVHSPLPSTLRVRTHGRFFQPKPPKLPDDEFLNIFPLFSTKPISFQYKIVIFQTSRRWVPLTALSLVYCRLSSRGHRHHGADGTHPYVTGENNHDFLKLKSDAASAKEWWFSTETQAFH